jgi:dolichyl-diphosphooligosaccharide--protein glycosyltransferase
LLVNTKLVSIGNFDLKLNHLLIIGVLSLSFTVSFLLRAQPAGYGFELNEFDPFFNYRATQYIVDNGIPAYLEWNDDLSWYPIGRDVSSNSQVTLHLTAAITYWIFGGGGELYDFTILFPAIFGSLSAIVIFALVRVIGGTTAGLFSALLFSVSLPILIRSPIGWFKSEPLGLFFALLAVYLLLSGINSQNKKISFSKLVVAGIFTAFSISA